MAAPRGPSRILNVSRRKPLIGIPADRRLINVHLDKDLKSARVLREMRQPR